MHMQMVWVALYHQHVRKMSITCAYMRGAGGCEGAVPGVAGAAHVLLRQQERVCPGATHLCGSSRRPVCLPAGRGPPAAGAQEADPGARSVQPMLFSI